jgi:23S rRNA (cytosine1962-C5)-methyltransferase
MNRIILNPGKEQSSLRFHPWIFSGAIKRAVTPQGVSVAVEDGETVEVYDSKQNFVAIGQYHNNSIAVRIISFEQTAIDQDFWNKKIAHAYAHRTSIHLTNNNNTNVYRLIHAEGDGLPGLIIDFYNGTAVIQSHSIGMHLSKHYIIEALKNTYGDALNAVYDKSEDTLAKPIVAKYGVKNGVLWGATKTNEVAEHGHKFNVNWETGQKTGFFIDQRENRQLLALYSKGKSVLNTFCYSGGFSVYALKAGATKVHSVDSSAKAIDLVNENVALNFGNDSAVAHESFVQDTFAFFSKTTELYDIIVLDPPAFAKHQDAKRNAIQGYKRLNGEALNYLKPGGLLFTFSCSQAVDKLTFNSTVLSAAIIAGRKVRVLHQLHQPADHAYSIYHPEGEYLKGLVLQVD